MIKRIYCTKFMFLQVMLYISLLSKILSPIMFNSPSVFKISLLECMKKTNKYNI